MICWGQRRIYHQYFQRDCHHSNKYVTGSVELYDHFILISLIWQLKWSWEELSVSSDAMVLTCFEFLTVIEQLQFFEFQAVYPVTSFELPITDGPLSTINTEHSFPLAMQPQVLRQPVWFKAVFFFICCSAGVSLSFSSSVLYDLAPFTGSPSPPAPINLSSFCSLK